MNDNQPEIQKVAWQEPFLDLLDAISSNKWKFITIITLGMLIGIIRLILMPYRYESSAVAVLLPREKAVVDAAIDTSSVEATDDRAGRSTAGNLMLPPDPNLYSTIIMSRAVLTEIAQKHPLQLAGDISKGDRSEEVISALRSMIKVSTTEEGIIKISVTSNSPELSSQIANSMFEECERVSRSIEQKLLLSQAEHLDKAYILAAERLEKSEQKIGELAENYGLIDTDLQASNQLRALRELRAARDKLDTDLEELLLSYTEESKEVVAVRARTAAINRQIDNSKASVIGDVSTNGFGRFNIVYTRLQQEARFQRDMLATIATKADIYRIRAEQPIGNLAIIRQAAIPNRPSGPSKKLELGVSMGLSLFIAIGVCLLSQ
ncbi:MAG: hypothetical protein HRT56_01550, partial [Coraliomargarita sp.]|nr:hypothetical protein [Coraliomargarita sp.]